MRPERRQSPAGGARQRLRLVGAEEEDGVLVRGGFHGAVRDVIDLKGNPKHQEVRDSADTSSAPASGDGSGTRLEPSAAGKAPGRGPGYGAESLRGLYQRNGKDPAPRSCGQRGPCATRPAARAGGDGRGAGRTARPSSVLQAGRGSLGVRRGAGEVFGAGGTLPQKSKRAKAEGLSWQQRQSRCHGEVQPSGVP